VSSRSTSVAPSGAAALAAEPPLAVASDPVEQWLLWEEQANLIGFRTATQPVEVAVASVPRERVTVQRAAFAPEPLVARFVRGDRVLVPKHPLNRDPGVAFFGEPTVERWWCRFTSSRTLVVPPADGGLLFSLKLPTDHPHAAFRQPEKTQLREEAADAVAWTDLLDRADALLGDDPKLGVVREVLAVLVPGTESGFAVRDLRLFQSGHYYLPALSIPWVGRQIAQLHGEGFASFWGRHYAAAAGRAKARLFARTGLQYETPNPQNLVVQLDARLVPTGRIMLRDIGDANCATDARSCSADPWSELREDLRPETGNSFWAFDEAGEQSVDPVTLAAWHARHDAAYFAELAVRFPEAARRAPGSGAAALAHWNSALRGPAGVRAVAAGFARWRARPTAVR
jgi:hypothetical protein